MKQQLEQLLLAALQKLSGTLLTDVPDASVITVERTRDSQHGDFATNVALRLAKTARRNPRELAQAIVAALPASPLVSKAEVAGAGFINFYLTTASFTGALAQIHELGDLSPGLLAGLPVRKQGQPTDDARMVREDRVELASRLLLTIFRVRQLPNIHPAALQLCSLRLH